MSAHLADERIVEFLDGTMVPAAIATTSGHLDGCADCRRRLAMLAAFDEFVQSNRPEEDATTSAMFDVSQRLLAGSQGRSFRIPLLLAALLLVGVAVAFAIARGGAVGFEARAVMVTVAEATRGQAMQRLHLELAPAVAVHVLAFARLPAGGAVQLLPEGESERVGPGAVRLPADELLDWEYPADAVPSELLVVLSPDAPSRELAKRLREAWAAAAPGTVPPLAIADGRTARVVVAR